MQHRLCSNQYNFRLSNNVMKICSFVELVCRFSLFLILKNPTLAIFSLSLFSSKKNGSSANQLRRLGTNHTYTAFSEEKKTSRNKEKKIRKNTKVVFWWNWRDSLTSWPWEKGSNWVLGVGEFDRKWKLMTLTDRSQKIIGHDLENNKDTPSEIR